MPAFLSEESVVEKTEFHIPPKCDIELARKIQAWKDGGPDEPVSGIIAIRPPAAEQFLAGIVQTGLFSAEYVVDGIYTFKNTPVSRLNSLLVMDPDYLIQIELSKPLKLH